MKYKTRMQISDSDRCDNDNAIWLNFVGYKVKMANFLQQVVSLLAKSPIILVNLSTSKHWTLSTTPKVKSKVIALIGVGSNNYKTTIDCLQLQISHKKFIVQVEQGAEAETEN